MLGLGRDLRLRVYYQLWQKSAGGGQPVPQDRDYDHKLQRYPVEIQRILLGFRNSDPVHPILSLGPYAGSFWLRALQDWISNP